ncbi:hypothetical protein EDB89DRAFT_1906094 [Lactarius sanguifluus]|nr:hypothetical protein EDB89DRAFT_1906094 [Lactarius sanguifluus]
MAGRQGLGVCWVGVVVSRWVAGSCAPCWDGMGVGGSWALRAALRWCGGSAGSWRAVLGWRGGLAVVGWRGRMEVVCVHEWAAISRVLRRVGVARWVGGGGVAGQDGGGSRARMGCNLQGLALCWGGEVGWRWWGVRAGWRWLACTNGGEQRCQRVLAKRVTCEFDSSRDEYSRPRVLVPEYLREYEWALFRARLQCTIYPKLLVVAVSCVVVVVGRCRPCRPIVVVDGYALLWSMGVAPSSSSSSRRPRRDGHHRLAVAGITPWSWSTGIAPLPWSWRHSIIVVASLSSAVASCCCWWWCGEMVACGPVCICETGNHRAWEARRHTLIGELLTPCELLTINRTTTTTTTTLVYDEGSGTSKWPAIRRRQTRAGNLDVDHDNSTAWQGRSNTTTTTSVHDDNDPRRQLLTTTTAYDDNDPPRQRPTTTTVHDNTDDDSSGGDTERH